MMLSKQMMKKFLVPILAFTAVFAAMLSCDHQQQNAQRQPEADSLLVAAQRSKDHECVIALCDSLQQTGDISSISAAYNRGLAYFRFDEIKLAENEYKKALAEMPQTMSDSLLFYQSACDLTNLYSVSGNTEGVLQLAIPKIEELKVWAEKKPSDQIFEYLQKLTGFVGFTQLQLGMKQEAEKMYELSIRYMDKQKSTSHTVEALYRNAVEIIQIIISFTNAKDFATAEKFLSRLDTMTSEITAFQDSTVAAAVDVILSNDYFYHAVIDNALNRPQEAARYLALYEKTQFAKTLTGRLNEAELLLKMKRYAESAETYAMLDQYFADYNMELSLDHMVDYGNKFKANYMAGRRDTALAVAAYVFENLDSAITKQKNSDAAELATVYQTKQKDAEIAEQQAELSQQRWIGTLVALVLLTVFFTVYTLHRRKAQKRLATAHQQLETAHEKLETAHTELQTAYNQLEATTAAKERIESELRIARDIQMSMVPGVFPEHEGLDMYAEMTTAKEVGGDLYGYVLQGENLYFCVGDVSGKGVPASLFMSQSARLFRTLATEGLTPVDIAVRMNNELAENNDRGMFVTMFIGMLHLNTGRLDYCNCGHNAPVIDGQFLKMAYDNAPLGLWEDDPFYGESIDDVRGRQLLIYTDGLNEAENQQQELLGNKRLLELMADTASLTSHQVIDMLKEAVEEHRAGAEPNDDLTLMCLKLYVEDV